MTRPTIARACMGAVIGVVVAVVAGCSGELPTQSHEDTPPPECEWIDGSWECP